MQDSLLVEFAMTEPGDEIAEAYIGRNERRLMQVEIL
jgi:hypothetical protein